MVSDAALNAGPRLDFLLAKVDSPGYGRHGRLKAREHADRYAAGIPYVAFSRKLLEHWRFVCPVPACLIMRHGFDTLWECRDAWFAHARQGAEHEGFTPAWPDDLVPEPRQMDLFDLAGGSVTSGA